jgi:hypothetical protein
VPSIHSSLEAQGNEVGLVAKFADHASAVVALGHYTEAVRVPAPAAAGQIKIAVAMSHNDRCL